MRGSRRDMAARILSILICGCLLAFARGQYYKVDVAPGAGTNPQGDSTAYTQSAWLDVNVMYHLKWDFDADKEHITFQVTVKTTGWVGFGFSFNGGMTGSDVVIGWVKDGQAVLTDRHALGENMPVLDKEQNYELLEGTENGTHTTLRFRRKYDTCDPDDMPITEGTNRLIYSWSLEDPTSADEILYHGPDHRGSRAVYISSVRPPKPVMPDDLIHMDFTVDRFNLPTKDTTYWCQAFLIPKLDQKHHIIKVEPLVEPGNEGFVHHIVLFTCYGDIDPSLDRYSEECGSPNMPPDILNCVEIAFNWAVGGGDFYFPEEAGLSIWGSEHDPRFFMLEMHYDNPGMKSGLNDASGLRLLLTPTLRKYDTGVIQQGHRYDRPYQVLPPHFKTLTQYAHCVEECLREGMDSPETENGIYIYANMPHLHLFGMKHRLHHYRGGQHIGVISNEEVYDFNLQEVRHVKPHVHVKPGDMLITECVYNTDHKDNITVGGLSTSEEMCQSIISYYPRFTLAVCETFPDMDWVLERLSGVNLEGDESRYPHLFVKDGPRAGQSFLQVIVNEKWRDESLRDKYQTLMDTAPVKVVCKRRAGVVTHDSVPGPNICVEKYRKNDTCGNEPAFEPRCETGAGYRVGGLLLAVVSVIFVMLF